MSLTLSSSPSDRDRIQAAADAAARAIPPLWSLRASVAVNPFLGHSDDTLPQAAARLRRVAGLKLAQPRSRFRDWIAAGEITDDDLLDALSAVRGQARPSDLSVLRAQLARSEAAVHAIPTVAELAAQVSGIDWPAIIADRLGHWAAAHFDQGQALWALPADKRPYASWRIQASHDLTPEILGLGGFAARVAGLPQDPDEALLRSAQALRIPADAAETCFHRLLMTLGGWAQYLRQLEWTPGVDTREHPALRELLAIRLIWEEALFQQYADRIEAPWHEVLAQHASPLRLSDEDLFDAVLQEALERAEQRRLALRLSAAEAPASALARATLHAVFCIDVRSETLRRALEGLDPGIRTSGFAGFFGLPIAHHPLASDLVEARLPVLLSPALQTCAGGTEDVQVDQSKRISARASRAWGRFQRAAVSSFAFVEAMGPVYAGKLLRDALGGGHAGGHDHAPPRLATALTPEERTALAERILRAMSLTEGFARLELLVGHGADVVNSPFASALQCGACGGYSGAVNARVLAGLLNEAAVRQGLALRGIHIPADTLFLAALHDTVSDHITLFEDGQVQDAQRALLAQARAWLDEGGARCSAERAQRQRASTSPAQMRRRGRDWSEVRPEWGLAGCAAFIAAPRQRTVGVPLDGRAFLHDYDWRTDPDFAVLELILTAPVVVASWISLQYFASSVAPEIFGSGSKLLHNVTGGIGVVEGNGGVLRSGLPWQSVHDGETLVHTPVRLSVCIEAPCEAISGVLARHPQVRTLFDRGWLHLFGLDEAGHMAWRYAPELRWISVPSDTREPAVAPAYASA